MTTWTAVANNTAMELFSSEARCSTAWTSRWWWATEWISVIWHSTTGEVCRTVSVFHMSAQWVWCNRVWHRPCNYSTFLHAGHACGAIMKLKNNYGENINLHLKQGAAMKAGFCGIDYKGLMSAEKQVTEAAKTGRKRRQVVQAGTSTSWW